MTGADPAARGVQEAGEATMVDSSFASRVAVLADAQARAALRGWPVQLHGGWGATRARTARMLSTCCLLLEGQELTSAAAWEAHAD